MKLRADQARTLYFNDYVEFDNLIREISKEILKQAVILGRRGQTLGELIRSLANHKLFSYLQVKSSTLANHKDCRNWLAHSSRNKFASKKQEDKFQNIKNVNVKLHQFLNRIKKEWHS